MPDKPNQQNCCSDSCGCAPSNSSTISRRDFTKATGAGILGATLLGGTNMPIMAGPFDSKNEYLKTIPQDKKLDPAWVKSLYERGEKQTYNDPNALKHIGMPIGGLFAGTVYLGGNGQLWLWDIFNKDQEGIDPRPVPFKGIDPESVPFSSKNLRMRDGANYIEPAPPTSPFKIRFGLMEDQKIHGFGSDILETKSFDGRYPMATIKYGSDRSPVEATLKAYSPFTPLNVDDSSLPATIMSYTIKNITSEKKTFRVVGSLENPVCIDNRDAMGQFKNEIFKKNDATILECSAKSIDKTENKTADILFEDFEKETYEGWEVTGDAFGNGPILKSEIPGYQGEVGGQGKRVVNSHASPPGNSTGEKDRHTGTLTSKSFTIERDFINLHIGGGNHKDKTCVNVLVDKKVVRSITGQASNQMRSASINVSKLKGKTAQIQIVDNETGGWGNIGVDQIVFSDQPLITQKLEELRDFGTMSLALPAADDSVSATAQILDPDIFKNPKTTASDSFNSKMEGALAQKIELNPGEEKTVNFVVSWHFPNFYSRGCGNAKVSHHYASRFNSSSDVAFYISKNFAKLSGDTQNWVDTWYDSTLPYWLLDRTMANTSILATTTCYRFKSGRFWAWEGIGCCPGTCSHVWQYAQAPGRIFPEIERSYREQVDFGLGQHKDGGVGMRAHLNGANHPADDGHFGRILGAYREHQMSGDSEFLKRLWPNIKRAIMYMVNKDGNDDGMIESAQHNTLDAAWYGKISWLASMYLATLHAGAAMATEMGDNSFAQRCKKIAEKGAQSILETYNGEYFIQIEDENHKDKIGIGDGCEIDQVYGQTWAHWVGLGNIFDREKQLSALRALYKYNFVPDIGTFRKKFIAGRWYATVGDAGLLMCTWPRQKENENFNKHWQYGYFNECMTGFEWQAAAHMIWEGIDQPDLLESGLAVSRAIHDRYDASLRNPYNEIECSDHYSRAMASYGVFQAVCGFNCHGPNGPIEFEPRIKPEDFKAPFITAEGWGTYSQKIENAKMEVTTKLNWGELNLKSFTVALAGKLDGKKIKRISINGKASTNHTQENNKLNITLPDTGKIKTGETLTIQLFA